MGKAFKLRQMEVSGPDSDGDFAVMIGKSGIYLSRAETRQLRDNLTTLLEAPDLPGFEEGDMVLIKQTSHKDLRGQIGQVTHVFMSGNLEVRVGSTAVVLDRDWVESV